jgi:hypothetical protein
MLENGKKSVSEIDGQYLFHLVQTIERLGVNTFNTVNSKKSK